MTPNCSIADNNNYSETSGGRQHQKEKEGIISSDCNMCGKHERKFCDSVVHGKEMGFEGLFEVGLSLWISDALWKFVPDYRACI